MKPFLFLAALLTAAWGQAPPVQIDVRVMAAAVEQQSITTAAQLQAIRIDKWKTDSEQKQRAQSNADSIVRNLTAALPTMISEVRAHPDGFAANFKLYRNLSALYDVLLPLTESAGAFGAKGEYQTLSSQLQRWDDIRRDYGDFMAQLAAQKDAAAAPAQAKQPPKKIIIDDTAPTKTTKKKKK